jgi:hypothetical protein
MDNKELVPLQTPGEPLFKRLYQQTVAALSGGWFGPQDPMPPAQPQTVGRQFDYTYGYNLYTQPRRDSGITFETLRSFADMLDLLRIVIETRKDQVAAFEWDVVAADTSPGVDPPPDVAAKCAEIKKFFKKPDGELPWHAWLRAVLEDLFVVDAITLFPEYEGIRPAALQRVDAATIKKVIDERGRCPGVPFPAYQQVLKGLPTSNYTRDELYYFQRNHRNNKVYGFSPVEQIIMTVNIALRRELSQLQWFTEGNIPEAIAGVPESWTAVNIAEFQKWWDSVMEGNTAARRKLKFIPGDASKINMLRTSEDTLKTPFDEWLMRIICYAFSTSPTPFVQQVNRATAETVQDVANEEGLVPLLDFLREMMNDIIGKLFKVEGIEFRWKLQEDVDPATQSDIDIKYLEHGVISIDDIRLRKGMAKLGAEAMVWTSSGPVPVADIVSGEANYLQPPQPSLPGGGGFDEPDAEKYAKEAHARSVSPFRYGVVAKAARPRSLTTQTLARNRRGAKYFPPR